MTTPSTPPAPAPCASAAPVAATSLTGSGAGSGRLGNGQLRRQVAEWLGAHPGDEFGPREIAHRLGGRSAGAVGNALEALVALGQAEQTSAKPNRNPTTPTTAGTPAATAPTPPPSPTPHSPPTAATTPPATATPTPATATSAAGATAGATPGGAVSGPVTRPNGQLYHPRLLSGMPDVTALRRLREAVSSQRGHETGSLLAIALTASGAQRESGDAPHAG